MDIAERKKILKEEYDKKRKKLEAEFKAEIINEKKKKIKELMKLLEEVIKTDNGIDIFDSKNHALIAGLLTEKIEDKEKFILAGEKILNRMKSEEKKIKEEKKRKRKAREEKKNSEIVTGEQNVTNE